MEEKTAVPLAPLAFVTCPAPLPGVTSWTIETVNDHDTYFAPDAVYRPDGTQFAVGSISGVIRVWDVKRQRLVRVLYPPSHGPRPSCLQFAWSSDGKRLASLMRFGTYSIDTNAAIVIWDTETSRELHCLRVMDPSEATSLSWCPTKPVLALAISHPGEVRFVDSVTGRAIGSISRRSRPGHFDWAPGLAAWSPDGGRLAVVIDDSRIPRVEVWDFARKELLFTLWIRNGDKPFAVQPTWSPDGKRLAFRSALDMVEIADVERQRSVASIPIVTKERAEVRFDWSADSQGLRGIETKEGYLDGKTGKRLKHEFEIGCNRLAWGPDGNSLVIAGNPWGILDLKNRKYVCWNDLFRGRYTDWSSDGRSLITTGPRQSEGFCIWDADSLRLDRVSYLPEKGFNDVLQGVWGAEPGKVVHLTQDGTLWCWDTRTSKATWIKYEFAEWNSEVIVSPAGNQVFVFRPNQAGKGQVAILDGLSGKVEKIVPADRSIHRSGSPDGRFVVEKDRILEAATGKETARLDTGWNLTFGPCRWSRDSKLICHDDGKVWEAATGKLLLNENFPGPAFSPDGKRLVCVRRGGYALWNVERRQWEAQVYRLANDKGVAIDPSGHYGGLSAEEAERHLAYVVRTEKGQEVLLPGEFAKRYGWTNEPAKVRLRVK